MSGRYDPQCDRYSPCNSRESNTDKWSREPKSIQDQNALEAAKRGEGKHEVIISSEKMKDPRWQGWDKYEVKVKSEAGKDSVVHYMKNRQTGEKADFKFKKHSTN